MTGDRRRSLLRLIMLLVCTMLGVILYISDIMMEFLPNIHLVGALIVVYTVVYRWYALIPIYIYAFLNGLFAGFGPWWVGYLYIWTILWGAIMLIPRGLGKKARLFLYVAICALHGFAFGFLYLPVQAIFFSSSPTYLMIWWSTGFVTADIYQGTANLIFGILLIYPLSHILGRAHTKFTENI